MVPGLFMFFGIPVYAKLSTVISRLEWHWPPARSDDILEIQIQLYDTIFPCLADDTILWFPLNLKGLMWVELGNGLSSIILLFPSYV